MRCGANFCLRSEILRRRKCVAAFIDDPPVTVPQGCMRNGVGCLIVAPSSKEANELAFLLKERDPPQAVRVKFCDREGRYGAAACDPMGKMGLFGRRSHYRLVIRVDQRDLPRLVAPDGRLELKRPRIFRGFTSTTAEYSC